MTNSVAPNTLSSRVLLLLTTTCVLSAGNAHVSQTLTPLIAADLRISPETATSTAIATQFGCGAGILLLTPLGDRISRRTLILTVLIVDLAGLLISAAAPTLPVLVAAGVLVGTSAAVPTVITTLAAGLVPDASLGRVTGILFAATTMGITVSRTVSGATGQWMGWRAPYLLSACLIVVLLALLARALPGSRPTSHDRYPALLISTLRLFREMPELRSVATAQASLYVAWMAAWTAMVLLLSGPDYRMSTPIIGLIALVSMTGIVITPLTGRLIDRRNTEHVARIGITAAAVAAGILAFGAVGGAGGVIALIVGLLVLDTATRIGHVAHQTTVLALHPLARSRLNSAYISCVLLSGSAGSGIGVQLYHRSGWLGICLFITALTGVSLAAHLHLARNRISRIA